jgi:hypothetical protein
MLRLAGGKSSFEAIEHFDLRIRPVILPDGGASHFRRIGRGIIAQETPKIDVIRTRTDGDNCKDIFANFAMLSVNALR